MGAAVELGNGTAIVFGTSGFAGQITKMDFSGISREAVDVSHLGSAAAGAGQFGGRDFKPGKLIDPGELVLTVHFDADTRPLSMEPAETITITFPLDDGESTASIWAGSGFCTDVSGPSVENDAKMEQTITLKLTGDWTITAAT